MEARSAALFPIVAAIGVATAFLLHAILPGSVQAAAPAMPVDILDEPNAGVQEADFEALLVQPGTTRPYTGNGPPGLNVAVTSKATIVEWTLVAWANATTPATLSLCSQDGIHWASPDWVFQADDGGGIYQTTPTTVPGRLGPDGDQCPLRIQATGTWIVRVCIEGKPGGPRGLYDAADGRHFDGWDRCLEGVFVVP